MASRKPAFYGKEFNIQSSSEMIRGHFRSFKVTWCHLNFEKTCWSKVNEREAYKRQLRESLKDQMRETAEKRRAEFENSRNETARTIHDFRSRR